MIKCVLTFEPQNAYRTKSLRFRNPEGGVAHHNYLSHWCITWQLNTDFFITLVLFKWKKNKKQFYIYASTVSKAERKKRWPNCKSSDFIKHSPCKYSTVLEASMSNSKLNKNNYSVIPNSVMPFCYIMEHQQKLQYLHCLCELFLKYWSTRSQNLDLYGLRKIRIRKMGILKSSRLASFLNVNHIHLGCNLWWTSERQPFCNTSSTKGDH